MSTIGTRMGNLALKYLLYNRNVWASLHVSDPGLSGNPASEVVGNDYERIEALMSSANGKTTVNREALTWDNLPYCTVRYAGYWTDDTNGEIIAYAAFPTPIQVASGKSLTIPPFKFAVTL